MGTSWSSRFIFLAVWFDWSCPQPKACQSSTNSPFLGSFCNMRDQQSWIYVCFDLIFFSEFFISSSRHLFDWISIFQVLRQVSIEPDTVFKMEFGRFMEKRSFGPITFEHHGAVVIKLSREQSEKCQYFLLHLRLRVRLHFVLGGVKPNLHVLLDHSKVFGQVPKTLNFEGAKSNFCHKKSFQNEKLSFVNPPSS